MNDQTRNLNPTLPARVAMIIWGKEYSEQGDGIGDSVLNVYFREPLDMCCAARLVDRFISEYPAPHKDCLYTSEWTGRDIKLLTYIKRTKVGNICVSQWDGK
jgi:hypothetical protein